MQKTVFTSLLLAGMVLIFAACGTASSGTDSYGNTDQSAGASAGGAASENSGDNAPRLAIVSPADGADIEGGTVTVKLDIKNFKLVDFRTNTAPKEVQGHVHAWLDQDTSDPNVAYKLIEGDTITYNNVPAGDHTLTVQLVENNHQPVQPEIKQVIHFKTSSGSGTGTSGGTGGESGYDYSY